MEYSIKKRGKGYWLPRLLTKQIATTYTVPANLVDTDVVSGQVRIIGLAGLIWWRNNIALYLAPTPSGMLRATLIATRRGNFDQGGATRASLGLITPGIPYNLGIRFHKGWYIVTHGFKGGYHEKITIKATGSHAITWRLLPRIIGKFSYSSTIKINLS